MKKNMIIWILIVVVVVIVLVFLSIKVYKNNPTGGAQTGTVPTEQTGQIPADNGAQVGNVAPSDVGAQPGDLVTVNYTGKLADGTVFDSNVDPKFNHVQPFQFTLGAGQVIPGWDKGLVGMKVGDKKTLVIPPEDAYGAAGAGGGVIPPNATLTFDVEVTNIASGTAGQ